MSATNPDDDYSPDVAVRLFPSIVVPRVVIDSEDSLQNAMDFDHLIPVDPSDLDLNSSAKTLFNYTFAPNGTWIFGPGEDAVALPLILSVIGIAALVGNALVLASFCAFRRMRSGQNAMLVNVSLADLSFVLFAVPVAIVNHAVPPTAAEGRGEDVFVLGAGLCSFVHYMVFVCFYVAVYTLVVVCVFRFFGEMMMMTRTGSGRGGGGDCTGSPNTMGGVQLSVCNASVSCVVIWIAFLTSHLNFVVHRDGAIYQQPFICRHTTASQATMVDPTKLRTLWVTFLACAFLFPLLVVCALSAAILHRQRVRRRCLGADELPYETAQNSVNDGQSKRQLTLLIMASTVARSLCWLPVQVYLLADAFDGGVANHGGTEMVGVCFALIGACVNPPIYFWVSDEFRGSFRQILWRMGCRWCGGGGKEGRSAGPPPGELKRCRATGGGAGGGQGTDLNETIMSIISDSSNHINYA